MPPVKPMNVLIYSGSGATGESTRHCLYSLRGLLSSHFAVSTVSTEVLLKEPWQSTCALLVFPGGADLPYCKSFNGEGNRKISQYVRRGGAYLGFCAGGYYGSQKCEFEVGNGPLEVVGSRELAFFPGICRGAAFGGFKYASEDGARAAEVAVLASALGDNKPYSFRCYFNGGGVFVDAEKLQDKGVEVLASFTEDIHVDGGHGKAAVVYCKVGQGNAILTGPHPEFAGINLNKSNGGPEYGKAVDAILEDEEKRTMFLRSCLGKLGLHASETETSLPPRLSRVHLTSINPADVGHLIDRLKDIITEEGSRKKMVCENDTFYLETPSSDTFTAKVMDDALPEADDLDYNKVGKHLEIHTESLPQTTTTPYFDHHIFYDWLRDFRANSRSSPSQFGTFMLYGETVTSTNTMLDKNNKFLQHLPNGLTFTATSQVAGRGRGNNVWISPFGSLIFSTVIRHSLSLSTQAPVIFVQYVVALAIVEAVKTYGHGYEGMQVRLKWPNDIYARDPTSLAEEYVKIGGILVNSSYFNREFNLVVGCGINVTNAAPTTSLNLMLKGINATRHKRGLPALPEFTQEKLLARVLVVFEELYYRFCLLGFSCFEQEYYKHWLHTDQVVTLEMEGGAKARITGITPDFGLLKAAEIGVDGRVTGKVFTLQSDGNSFDFFKGLLKRKA
ncbi:biotin-protein ligase [Geopyxis carbonaria]|nr:biotin-protein ligase [Geopyxis carbonaria]